MLLGPTDERLSDAVGEFAVVVVQVVVNYQVAVAVKLGPAGFVQGAEVVAGVVLAASFGSGKENGVVVLPKAEWAGVGVVVPFLEEKDAGFGAGVRLKRVGVQSDDGQDASAFGDEIADVLVGGVVEPALGQDDGHATAGA